MLGKGAYGKVWEGLMDSAKMIAVKEVELDCESAERAQAVSHAWGRSSRTHCFSTDTRGKSEVDNCQESNPWLLT